MNRGSFKNIQWLKVAIVSLGLFALLSLSFYAGHKFPVLVAPSGNSYNGVQTTEIQTPTTNTSLKNTGYNMKYIPPTGWVINTDYNSSGYAFSQRYEQSSTSSSYDDAIDVQVLRTTKNINSLIPSGYKLENTTVVGGKAATVAYRAQCCGAFSRNVYVAGSGYIYVFTLYGQEQKDGTIPNQDKFDKVLSTVAFSS